MDTFVITPLRKMSPSVFYKFCTKNPDLRMELDKKGKLNIMSPSGIETGYFNLGVAIQVFSWNLKKQLGYAFDSSAGFTLPNGAVRSPDASWVLKHRYDALSKADRKKFAAIVPDFVIELMSPSDSEKALKLKMEEYIENGVRLGFLINPEKAVSYVYHHSGTVTEVKGYDTPLLGYDVMPDFELELSILKT